MLGVHARREVLAAATVRAGLGRAGRRRPVDAADHRRRPSPATSRRAPPSGRSTTPSATASSSPATGSHSARRRSGAAGERRRERPPASSSSMRSRRAARRHGGGGSLLAQRPLDDGATCAPDEPAELSHRSSSARSYSQWRTRAVGPVGHGSLDEMAAAVVGRPGGRNARRVDAPIRRRAARTAWPRGRARPGRSSRTPGPPRGTGATPIHSVWLLAHQVLVVGERQQALAGAERARRRRSRRVSARWPGGARRRASRRCDGAACRRSGAMNSGLAVDDVARSTSHSWSPSARRT